MEINEKLALNVTEAAKLMGVSRTTMYQIMRTKDFPVVHLGGRILISRAGLQRWLDKLCASDSAT